MDSKDSTVLDEGEYKKFLEDAIAGNYFKDCSFAKLHLTVIKGKEAFVLNKEGEEKLFNIVIEFLRDPRLENYISIFSLQTLAYIPPTTPVGRLKEIAHVVCDKVFSAISHNHNQDEVIVYADFCKAFAFLKATISEGDSKQITMFEEVLITTFLEKLRFRFSFRQRFQDLAKHYKGSEEKKEKWILQQSEEYNRNKRVGDSTSIAFLCEMYTLYPEIVFRVLELLLSTDEQAATQYLSSLLESLQGQHLEYEYWEQIKCTDISAMQKNHLSSVNFKKSVVNLPNFNFHTDKKDLRPVIENVRQLSEQNAKITLDLKNLLLHITEDSFLKDNSPQDYISYCIIEFLERRSDLGKNRSILKSTNYLSSFNRYSCYSKERRNWEGLRFRMT